MSPEQDILEQVKWNDAGLVPAIAQDAASGRVLMLAWMNRDALRETLRRGQAVYWSRSRQQLWHKGEQSGNVQNLVELRIDCDADTLLLSVEQVGGVACHTGRESCMYRRHDAADGWVVVDPQLVDPADMYRS